ncbi:MAG: peptide-methionine (R)-S-oxide reductase MsrB [Arhodomonas sp.]|nr:peptide-methionine (R)-S-oxide reductase MsrB [Arhodomonas sp.]
MRRRRLMTLLLATPVLSLGLARLLPGSRAAEGFPFQLSESEWRQRLGGKAYAVLREEDTEPPGSSPLLEEKRTGIYACAGCGQDLFRSETKYDSGTGWPSFYDVIDGAVGTREDRSLFLGTRTEVHCSRCGGHLGHVFEDGPPPTGLRYCINGLALEFRTETGAAG